MRLIDPCIISGGTQICDPKDGTILWQYNIEKADVQAIKNILVKYPDYGLIINDFSEDDYFGGGFPADQLDTNQDIFFAEGVACILGTSQKPGHKDIHMTNKAATKEQAVAELLIRLKVGRQHTWGFGD